MDTIHQLYQNVVYPPMSHPPSDPAVTAVSARMSGLECPHPRGARILEIGCCSGHNLIPLAMRWPESRFTGIDLAERSIAEARERAEAVGLSNITFLAADLTTFTPQDGPYDYIIAHGFWSWVPDAVKAALLQFCRAHLTKNGIATVSFNVEAGWKPRQPVIAKARAIQQAGGVDILTALEVLKTVTDPADPERAIIDDMMAKGAAILACDDFGPVNDPWRLDHFVEAAAGYGLNWLGGTEQPDPASHGLNGQVWDRVFGAMQATATDSQGDDGMKFHMELDHAISRTFRSEILCCEDAELTLEIPDPGCLPVGMPLAFRRGPEPFPHGMEKFQPVVSALGQECIGQAEIETILTAQDAGDVAEFVNAGVWYRALLPRIEPVKFPAGPPELPLLDRFRLLCARQHLPLVDIWHKPCAFPENHYQVLAAMDGSRTIAELAELSRHLCPELDFHPWLHHLAGRGMFG